MARSRRLPILIKEMFLARRLGEDEKEKESESTEYQRKNRY
jgi:hypothetical protein